MTSRNAIAVLPTAKVPSATMSQARRKRAALRLPFAPAPGAGRLALIAGLFIAGIALCFAAGVSVADVAAGFSFNVLVIVIAMDLFTTALAQTGIMEAAALRIARLARGSQTALLVMVAAMMFFISSCLNNITAILMVLPVMFVLLQTIAPDKRYLNVFFAVLLAMSNTGGAASAVGDLPAVLIMSTGVVSFADYTLMAFPLMAATSVLIVGLWCLVMRARRVPEDRDASRFALRVLEAQYRFARVDHVRAVPLLAVLACMLVCWMAVPSTIVPPEVIAIVGALAGLAICRITGGEAPLSVDMSSVLTISGFLFLASAVSATGALEALVAAMAQAVPDERLFLALVLFATSIAAGLVGAGPAAAACLPVVVNLATTTFAAHSAFLMVAYGAAVCAGSSLFLFSATAGYVLSSKIDGAELDDSAGRRFAWNVKSYLAYGVVTYLLQITIALAFALCF